MGPHSEARPICEFSPDQSWSCDDFTLAGDYDDFMILFLMILYDALADDGFNLNNPLSRGMKSMIVSRTKVDHCLKNDDVDGEYDMNDGGRDDKIFENNDRGPGRGKLPCQ